MKIGSMMPAWCISWWRIQHLQMLGVRAWSAVYPLHASSNLSHSSSSSSCMLHRSSIKICLPRWWAVFQSRAPQSTVRLASTSTAPPKQTMELRKQSKTARINNPLWSNQCPPPKHRVRHWISLSRVWTLEVEAVAKAKASQRLLPKTLLKKRVVSSQTSRKNQHSSPSPLTSLWLRSLKMQDRPNRVKSSERTNHLATMRRSLRLSLLQLTKMMMLKWCPQDAEWTKSDGWDRRAVWMKTKVNLTYQWMNRHQSRLVRPILIDYVSQNSQLKWRHLIDLQEKLHQARNGCR